MRLYFAIRCWLNRPVTYRDYAGRHDGSYFVMCKHCRRQIEVAHERA